MALTIPEAQHGAFALLVSLSAARRKKLADILRGDEPEAEGRIASELELEKRDAADLFSLITTMYRVRHDRRVPDSEQFVNDVLEAAARTKKPELTPPAEHEADFKSDLVTILSNSTMSVAVKLNDVASDHAQSLCHFRVLTDIRTIFDDKLEPMCGVIVHMLKVVYHEGSQTKELHVAMDTHDLQELERVLQRARQKEDALKDVLGDTDLVVMDWKSHSGR